MNFINLVTRIALAAAVGIAAGVGIYVGVMGLNAWRRELSGKAEWELARRALRQVYEVRDTLRQARDVRLPRFGGRVDCVTHLRFKRPSVSAVGAVEIAKRFPRTSWAARPFAPSTGPAASIAPQGCSL